MKTLEEYLRHYAHACPDKTAIRSSEEAISYHELWQAVCERAEVMENYPRRALVIRADQSIDFILSYFAAHKAGKVIVPLEKDFPEYRFQDIVSLVDRAVIPEDVSDILFTTGTTGRQKGTMISQSVIISDAENLIDAQGFSPDLTFIITGPLNHIGSLSKIWPSVMVGATIYIMDGIRNMDAFFEVVRMSPTKVATFQVPASLRMLIQFAEKQLKECSGKFDFIETGAAPISQADMEALCKLLPGVRLFNTYASTETGIIATHNFNAGYCVAGCLGRPMKHSSLEISDEGFIVCGGKTVMSGYCGDKEETDKILRNHLLYTHDKGTLDKEGRLHLSGRDDDIINVGGFKINPVEVEDVVMAMPGIADCICVPAPHPVIGTALRLLYVVKESIGVEKREIARSIATRLENHKVPHLYTQVEKIERTYNGKLNRKFYLLPQSVHTADSEKPLAAQILKKP